MNAEGIGGESGFGLYLFTVDPELTARARAAGIDTTVIDWEWRGKEERQRGIDTEVNYDTPKDLAVVSAVGGARVCCRLNPPGRWTRQEVDLALEKGAAELLLPMVETPEQVEHFLACVDGRARAGILVETVSACARARELSALPLDSVYVGLQDLSIQRRDPHIFSALADGTVEALREAFSAPRFGFGGVTVVDGGEPVPCRELMAEMARLECSFSFLRRSFKRDVVGRDMTHEVARIHHALAKLRTRTPAAVHTDREALVARIGQLQATHSYAQRAGACPP